MPLHGTKVHPLSEHALLVLERIANRAAQQIPRQEVNPGVADRLESENLVECINARSPYASHKGGQIRFLRITAAGLAKVTETGRSRND